jgi:hypothetical protein
MQISRVIRQAVGRLREVADQHEEMLTQHTTKRMR